MILIELSSAFSFFSASAWTVLSVLHLFGGVVGIVKRPLGMLPVAIRFRSLNPRQGSRMGMLGVATGTQLVDILYAPSMQGDGSSQHHVTGKIPYALEEWVRGHLRERSHHASVIVDVP